MPKIITLTPNTALDMLLTLAPFALGDTVQAEASQTYAAGKGINVAKALASLKQAVIVQGFVGQGSRHMYEALVSDFLQVQLLDVEGSTRSNITLSCPLNGQETHIRTAGYQVSADICDQGRRHLLSQIEARDIVILSGSLPLGAPIYWYQQLTEQCQQLGAQVIVDSSGPALSAAMLAQPFMLKPNEEELATLVARSLPDAQAVVVAAQSLVAQGIGCVVVSRADKGALLVTKTQVLSAIYCGDTANCVSSVGCGDALVAGIAMALKRGDNWSDVLALGVACGTANLFSLEPGCVDSTLLAAIHPQVRVRSLL